MKKTPKVQNVPLVHARVFDVRLRGPSFYRQEPIYLDDARDSGKFWSHIARTLDPEGVKRAAQRKAAAKREAQRRNAKKCAARKKAGLIPPPVVVPEPPPRTSDEKPWILG